MSRLASVLPGGEWFDVEGIDNPFGLMAPHTIQGTARRTRNPAEEPLYLKLILERGDSAVGDSRLLATSSRLGAIESVLGGVRVDGRFPLVPIEVLERTSRVQGLLIGMKKVEVLASRISSGEAGESACVNVLETLCSANCFNWVHGDICPRNVGYLQSRYVFIDPDSVREVSERMPPWVAGFKPKRLSARFREYQDRETQGQVLAAEARAKHDAEVILLAAECCLEQIFDIDMPGCFDEVETWCERSQAKRSLRDFWIELLRHLHLGEELDPRAIAREMRRMIGDAKTEVRERGERVPSNERKTEDVSSTVAHPEAAQAASGQDGWAMLGQERRRLRREEMDRGELQRYLELLLNSARTGADLRFWKEALYVTMAFMKDPIQAEKVAEEALVQHPNEEEVVKDLRIARMWNS